MHERLSMSTITFDMLLKVLDKLASDLKHPPNIPPMLIVNAGKTIYND